MTEIKKMAEIIKTKFSCMIQGNFCDRFFQCKDCPHNNEYSESIATALTKAGYRKQSDTVKEFAEKVNRKAEIECDSDFNISIYNLESLTETIAAEFGVEEEK